MAKFGKFAWKIWVPIAAAVVLLVILLAALIPRPVPCDIHFANVTSVSPASICPSADGLNVTVYGNGFLDIEGKLPVVTIDGAEVAFTLGDCEDLQIYRRPNVFDCHTINIAVPAQDASNTAPRKIKVVNAEPCSSEAEAVLDVSSSVNTLVLFADPPVIYQNASIQVTLYTSGLNATVEHLIFRNTGTGETFNLTGHIVSYGANFNELLVDIDAFDLPEGTYDIIVVSQFDISGCFGLLRSGLIVRAEASIIIQSVDPSFIWIEAATSSFTVVASAAGQQFQRIPRAYLSRAGVNAIPLRGVSFISGQSIAASVDNTTLSVGPYDLIVINPQPDSQVGVLRNAVVVTDLPPPVITSISPDGLVIGGGDTTQINGANFNNITAVTLDCGNILGLTSGQFTADIGAQTSTSVTITAPITDIYALTGTGKVVVCTVTLFNEDQSFARFTGFSVKGSAMNLDDFTPVSSMQSPRRAAALTIGQPTQSTSVLYAIGGDAATGTAYADVVPSAYRTIDSAPLDIYGKLGTWTEQRNQLPSPCTFLSAVTVSQFVYVQCGNNGTGPSNAVYRAHILNPLATPSVFADTTFVRDETAGSTFNSGGAFLYRVSAVFAENDESNPGGESLPGDTFTIYLPVDLDASLGNFHVNLSWDEIPDAVAYRVYRTENGTSAAFGLLAEVTVTFYEDTSDAVNMTVVPLPDLSLGVWHEVSGLTSPRAWGSLLATNKPSSATEHFIFSFGGLSDASTPLASYEFTTVTVTAAASAKGRESQTIAAWTESANNLITARFGLQAVTLTNEFVSQVPVDGVQIYVGGGSTGGGGYSQEIETAALTSDGVLTFTATTNSANGPLDRAGYCMFVYKTSLGQIGFTGGASSSQGKAGSLTDVAAFSNSWNAGWSGTSLNLISCTKQRPFVFIIGGTDGVAASAQTLYSVV